MKRLALLFCLLCGAASADSGMLLGGVADRQMPLDPLPTGTSCYSEWRLRTAYVTNKAKTIVRASDSTTTDIGFLADGSPDTATEATFLTATTGKLVTLYDQCSTRDLTQAVDANRFTRQASCLSTLSCNQATAAAQTHASAASITPANGLVSFAVIANRAVGTGAAGFIRQNGANNRVVGAGANAWRLTGASGAIDATAADASWHSGVAVMNGASSTFMLDGTSTGPGSSPTGNTTAAATSIIGSNTTTINTVEQMYWDNVALSTAQQSYIYRSQRIRGRF